MKSGLCWHDDDAGLGTLQVLADIHGYQTCICLAPRSRRSEQSLPKMLLDCHD
ncbi:hypothetical protein FOXYSP1_14339 [Fusarium oxysporum f. sp. phaseoli]